MRSSVLADIVRSTSWIAVAGVAGALAIAASGDLVVPMTLSVVAGILLAGGRLLSGGTGPRRQTSPIPVRVRDDRNA